MKLELNEFLQEIYSWKSLIKIKNEETESLQKKLSFALKQNEVLENSRTSLFHEVTKLNGAVSSLRNSFIKIEVFEEDRKILLEENQKLKTSLESLEKLCRDQENNVRSELQKLKEVNREETTKLIAEIETKASKQLDVLKVELRKKENHILVLNEEKNELSKQKEEDILKLKIEYEDKIGKLKQHLPKSRMQTLHGLQIHDVFRQKYHKLEKESEEEILQLKEQITSLKSLTDSLRTTKTGCTCLSTSVLSTNKQRNINTAEVYTQTDDHSFLQLNECHGNDDFDMPPNKKRIIDKHQSVVLPQKRKLFNLSNNYYTK